MKIKKLDPNVKLPEYKTTGAAGMDLASNMHAVLYPGDTIKVTTGIAVAIPQGYVGLLCSRSGLTAQYSINVLNAPGIIDSDYRGEICVLLHNHGEDWFSIKEGDRIAQLVISHCYKPNLELVTDLDETTRGEDGFGSTGVEDSPLTKQFIVAYMDYYGSTVTLSVEEKDTLAAYSRAYYEKNCKKVISVTEV